MMAKKTIIFGLLIFILLTGQQAITAKTSLNQESTDYQVLLILGKYYGVTYHALRDNLEKYGCQVTVAGLQKKIPPCPSAAAYFKHPAKEADILIPEIKSIDKYDALGIMTASRMIYRERAFDDLLTSRKTLDLLARAHHQGKVIFASCTAVRVLAAAGILKGKKILGNIDYQFEYKIAGATYLGMNRPPLIDGNIITAVRGTYHNYLNSQAIIQAIEKNRRKRQFRSRKSKNFFNRTNSLSHTSWSRIIGGRNSETANAVVATKDGCFVFTGYTNSGPLGNMDVFLIKVNSRGRTSWQKIYQETGSQYASSLLATADGGYLLAGHSDGPDQNNRDFLILKTNSRGKKIWQATFGGQKADVCLGLTQVSDGHFFVCGYSNSFGSGSSDVLVIKINSMGTKIWQKTYGGSEPDFGNSIIATDQGELLIAGSSGSFSKNQDVYLLKIDQQGNKIWEKHYGAPTYDWGQKVIATPDGGYLVVGHSDGKRRKLMDVYLIKTDSDGKMLWEKRYGEFNFFENGQSICQDKNGGFVICGLSKSPKTLKNHLYLSKIDHSGKILWKKIIESRGNNFALDLCPSQDNGYLIVGSSTTAGNDSFDILIAKTKEKLITE